MQSACAIVASACKGTLLQVKKFTNLNSLIKEYGPESPNHLLVSMAKVLFANNVASVFCIAADINKTPSVENYSNAFKILQCLSGFYSIICDSDNPTVIKALCDSINQNSIGISEPHLAFVGLNSNIEQLCSTASSLKNDRLVLTFPPSFSIDEPNIYSSTLSATALAALIASSASPNLNLNGTFINNLSTNYPYLFNNHLDKLSKSGVSTLNKYHYSLELHRLISSQSISPNLSNNIIYRLILDDIIKDINLLISNLKQNHLFDLSDFKSIINQIIIILSKKKDLHLISEFKQPSISTLDNNSLSINIAVSFHSYFDSININTHLPI